MFTAAALLASLMVRVYWPSDLWDDGVCMHACVCVWSSVSNEITLTSYFIIITSLFTISLFAVRRTIRAYLLLLYSYHLVIMRFMTSQ